MKEKIDKLVELGMTKEQAIEFVKGIADESYTEGYYEGMNDEPAIIGSSLGKEGMDFYEWWTTVYKG